MFACILYTISPGQRRPKGRRDARTRSRTAKSLRARRRGEPERPLVEAFARLPRLLPRVLPVLAVLPDGRFPRPGIHLAVYRGQRAEGVSSSSTSSRSATAFGPFGLRRPSAEGRPRAGSLPRWAALRVISRPGPAILGLRHRERLPRAGEIGPRASARPHSPLPRLLDGDGLLRGALLPQPTSCAASGRPACRRFGRPSPRPPLRSGPRLSGYGRPRVRQPPRPLLRLALARLRRTSTRSPSATASSTRRSSRSLSIPESRGNGDIVAINAADRQVSDRSRPGRPSRRGQGRGGGNRGPPLFLLPLLSQSRRGDDVLPLRVLSRAPPLPPRIGGSPGSPASAASS